jgi:hypothetical protein
MPDAPASPLRGNRRTAYEPFPGVRYPVPPPDIPDGWQAGPPDVVGVGTMRSGTTWWWMLLTQHPRFSVLYKELHFFDHHMRVSELDPESYHRYFPRPAGTITGEWTPRYMFDYWTIPMLRQAAPEARILVLVRDPLERYLSGLAFTKRNGHPATHAMLHQQYSRSLYGHQLRTLISHFPIGQVLVLQYEQCVADPVANMRRTLDFIGLDPGDWHSSVPTGLKVNETRVTKPDLDQATRAALLAAFQADLDSVFTLFPGLDPSLWPTMSSKGY